MARDDEPIAPEARTLMPSGLMRLEERIVLDASGIVDDHAAADNAADHPNDSHPPSHHDGVTDAHADGDAHMDSVGSTDPISDVVRAAVERTVASLLGHDAAEGGPPRVLAVSSSVHQADALAAAADGVHTVVFDGELASLDTLLQQIRQALGGRLAESIAIGTHGVEAGGFHLAGGAVVDLQSLQNPDMQAFWHALGAMVAPGGRIDLLACDAAAGPEGEALIESLEQLTGVNFAASVDRTGNVELGGDWVLETDGVRAGAIYFDAGRLPRFSEVLDNQPTITDTDPGNTAAGGGSAVVVDAGITVDDGDGGGDTLQGAAVRIKSGFHAGEDQLAFNTGLATGFGISGSYDAATGELILSGAASAAEYQQVLRTVTYQNTSGTPDTTAREIIFVIGDDFDTPGGFSYNAQNGHYYQLVDNQITWAAAEAAAAGSNLGGLQGYLHTLTSAGENTFVTNLIPGGQVFWLAASDAGTEGDWTWVAGPETGTQFWDGNASGTPVGGLYNNWGAGQPDNDSGADHSWIQDDGAWYSELGSQNARYFVEYGGMGTDAQGQFVAAVTLNVTSSNNAPVLDNTGDMYLSAIDEDDVASSGTTVANVIASATGDRITDVDGGALEGIAIIGVDSTHGDWRFSTDGGTTWNDIGAVANNNALLLRDTDLIRFQPDADWNGTVATGITFRAWDQTDGSPGAYGDASTSGGTSAFSTATETASITVNSINDVPTVSTPLVDQPATEDVLFTYQFGAASF
ncbi:MAG: DUF4347 domain-containing protein, partial [Sedimentisphaerales bacterium]|nr:DUF4347 domain-containing protein [Sedimentisphaerales bacterium]